MDHNKILNQFRKTDLIMYQAALEIGPIDQPVSTDFFYDLCDSIVSQQLSVKAANTIFGRLTNLFPEQKITPENIISVSVEDMRACGLSFSKAAYIKDLASKVLDNSLNLNNLIHLKDEEVITLLTKVKGIGRWTAEMFLMFSLAREDVFSVGDLGLKNAIIRLYKLKTIPTPKKLLTISKKWTPYRTYASRVLWKTLNNTPL